MESAELHFDLRAVVLGGTPVGGNAPGAPAEAPALATCNVGLVFSADLWDLYLRALCSLNAVWLLDVVDAVDICMRSAFFVLCAANTVEYWLVDRPKPVELDAMAAGFVVVSCAGILLYVLERLVGRYGYAAAAAAAAAAADHALPMEIVNRVKFSSTYSALAVTTAHLAGAAACALALLFHASQLRLERNLWSIAAIAAYVVTDTIYAFARLPRFGAIANQSAAAAHIAGTHTLLSLCVGLPFGVLLCVHAVRDEL